VAAVTVRARVRGIYTTAVTQRLLAAGHEVVGPSPPIRERFDELTAGGGPATATVETTADRLGVELTGDDDAVNVLREELRVAPDALATAAALPAGSVHDGRVTETLGGGAVVDCGSDEGYLPYDAVDDYLETGDELRVQVREPAPPWDDDRPLLGTALRVERPLVTLAGDRSGTSAAVGGEDATELVRTTELLSNGAPDGWGIRWQPAALDAGVETMDAALAAAAETATDLADLPPERDPPRTVATPRATTWLRFGRGARVALDEDRRAVTTTMPGHHRIKAGTEAASAAVDFVEAVADPDGDDEFPFAAVARQFGPREGDRIAIAHGKPDGRAFRLGRGEVTSVESDGTVTVRREMRSAGTYDGLGTDREPGDEAVTKLREGRSWYPTIYRGADGESKGTYVNVCTPVEVFPDAARYVDLHVDVVKRPDGTVERVDDDELDAAVDAGDVPEELAERARTVAASVERALSD
jgi:protein associated with RNAse G/E